MRYLAMALPLLVALSVSALPAGPDEQRPRAVLAQEGPQAVSRRALDPASPYLARRSNSVRYEVDFSVVVTAPYHSELLRVWLPLPQSDAGQEVEKGEITTFPTQVAPRIGREPEFGNQFAYFEFGHPEGAQVIRHRFGITVWELQWDIDPDKITRPENWPVVYPFKDWKTLLGGRQGRGRALCDPCVVDWEALR